MCVFKEDRWSNKRNSEDRCWPTDLSSLLDSSWLVQIFYCPSPWSSAAGELQWGWEFAASQFPCDVCAAGKNPSGSHGPTQKLFGRCTMGGEIRKLWLQEMSAVCFSVTGKKPFYMLGLGALNQQAPCISDFPLLDRLPGFRGWFSLCTLELRLLMRMPFPRTDWSYSDQDGLPPSRSFPKTAFQVGESRECPYF